MGGLLASDALLEFIKTRPDQNAPLWPRIIACIAFDTPVSHLADHCWLWMNPSSLVPWHTSVRVQEQRYARRRVCECCSGHCHRRVFALQRSRETSCHAQPFPASNRGRTIRDRISVCVGKMGTDSIRTRGCCHCRGNCGRCLHAARRYHIWIYVGFRSHEVCRQFMGRKGHA